MAIASSDGLIQPSLTIENPSAAGARLELSRVPTGSLKSGDIAFLSALAEDLNNNDRPFYILVKTATVAANGTTILISANSNGGTQAGRWIQSTITFDIVP